MKEKHYDFKMRIEIREDATTQKIRNFHNRFILNENFYLNDVAGFINTIKLAIQEAIKIIKSDAEVTSFEVSLIASGETFDRWFTDDITDVCIEKGEESLYLRPDTDYTNPQHDMALMLNNILESITC